LQKNKIKYKIYISIACSCISKKSQRASERDGEGEEYVSSLFNYTFIILENMNLQQNQYNQNFLFKRK